METGERTEKISDENCHEFDLPVSCNVKEVLVEHLALDLRSDIESKSFEGTVTYYIQPVKACKADTDRSIDFDARPVLSSVKNTDKVLLGQCDLKSSPCCDRQCCKQILVPEKTHSCVTAKTREQASTGYGLVQTVASCDSGEDICGKLTKTKSNPCSNCCEIDQESVDKLAEDSRVTDKAEQNTNVSTTATDADTDTFEFILDSFDVEIMSAEELFLPGSSESGIADETLRWPEKKSYLADHKDYTRKTCSLSFSVEKWCVKIQKAGLVKDVDIPRCIRLQYKTRPQGASLKWCSDQDGKLCVFTHGHWLNNRSLFPAQDSPMAMATWEARICVPEKYTVLMSGDEPTKPIPESDGYVCYKYFTTMKMPASTLALAVGQWNHVTLCEPLMSESQGPCRHYPAAHYNLNPVLPCRLFAPESMMHRAVSEISDYIPSCMNAAHKLLGNHPFSRLDILMVPKSFASLALACPSMMMISQTLLPGDQSECIRLAHELSHSWFGLLIGPSDWTEEWLTEGFATYLEDCIHGEAMQWDSDYKHDYFELRAVLRHRNLTAEMTNTDEELQVLRPVTDREESEEGSTVYVKHGMNPNKTFTQVHYLKGYFLLRYLSHLVGVDNLGAFIKQFVDRNHGQLVNSQNVLEHLFETCPVLRERGISVESLYRDWLDTPGMPQPIQQLTVSDGNRLSNQVNEEFNKWKPLMVPVKSAGKGVKRKISDFKSNTVPSTSQLIPDQLVLLLELFLEIEHCPVSVLKAITKGYNLITANADVRHRWCELIIKLRCSEYYDHVREFLINDQAMGVYLFGELIISEDRKQRQLAESCFKEISSDMEEGPYRLVHEILYGHSADP